MPADEPEILQFGRAADPSGEFDLLLRLPPDATTQLQFSIDLSQDGWRDYGSTIFRSPNGTNEQRIPGLAVLDPAAAAAGVNRLFFRTISHPIKANFSDDGSQVCLNVDLPQTLHNVLDQARRQLEADIVLPPGVDQEQMIPVGNYCQTNLSALFRGLGINVWEQLAAADEPALADRFPGDTSGQSDPLPEPPRPTEAMDDGFAGNPTLPDPAEGESSPIPPENRDKMFTTNFPPNFPYTPQEPLNLPEAGAHYRVGVTLTFDGGVVTETGIKCLGSALLPAFTGTPGEGSLITVVLSASAAPTAVGNIYHLGVTDSPWAERAYPPSDEAHLYRQTDVCTVRLAIPLPAGQTVLPPDLTVEFYRVSDVLSIATLTPESFTDNIAAMTLLGSISSADIGGMPPPGLMGGAANQSKSTPQSLSTRASEVTALHTSGPRAQKLNLVVVGDGFQDTMADQTAFNNFVQNTVMRDLMGADVNAEIMNALNIFRVNTYSVDQGVTLVNTNGGITTARSTALEYRYSGAWNRCWMEPSPTSIVTVSPLVLGGTPIALIEQVYARVPEADYIIIVLNNMGQGGCARGGNTFACTLASPASTLSHELGHMFGGLQDEYLCQPTGTCMTNYTGAAPPEPNQSVALTNWNQRAVAKWNEWIPSWRPLPTMSAQVHPNHAAEDVGYFAGGTRGNQSFLNGLFRPSLNNRMQSNVPRHSPVGYVAMRERARQRQTTDFRQHVSGDFNGDGRSDVLLHDGNQLSLFIGGTRPLREVDPILGRAPRPDSAALQSVWIKNGQLGRVAVPGGLEGGTALWEITAGDRYIPADFDGDGLVDLFVINTGSWSRPYVGLLKSTGAGFTPLLRYDVELPGWGEIRQKDKFFTGDFDRDGRTDLYVFNGKDWDMPYLLMLRSTGTALEVQRRFDGFLPNWEMGRQEEFLTGDFDGDRRTDLLVLNKRDWVHGHIQIYRSTGTGLEMMARHYGTFNGWALRVNDQVIVLPSTGHDKTSQIAFFNGLDWDSEYLLLAQVGGGSLSFLNRYRDKIPGWDFHRHDRFIAADVDGSFGPADLVVQNTKDWASSWLGVLKNQGNGQFSGAGQGGWIGSWWLSDLDVISRADFTPSSFGFQGPWNDLFICNQNWFGLLRSVRDRYALVAIYPKWIHNHRYHENGYW